MHRTTTRTARSAAAVLAAAAALTLSACQQDVDPGSGSAGSPATPTATSTKDSGSGGSSSQAPGTQAPSTEAPGSTDSPSASESEGSGNQATSVRLTPDGKVNGVTLPASTDAVTGAVNRALGTPTKKTGTVCELSGDTGPTVTLDYGDITFYGEAPNGAPMRIKSWTIEGDSGKPINAPYGVGIGFTQEQVMSMVPGAKLNEEGTVFNDGPVITKGDLTYNLARNKPTVLSIQFRPVACE